MSVSRRAWIAAVVLGLLAAVPVPARAQEKVPVLLDTDLGSDIGDAFALALLLKSPEIDLKGITTVGGDAEMRARMVGRLLTAVGRKDIPVAWGRAPQPATELDWQIQYGRHPAVVFNRTLKPVKESAVELLYAQLKAHPGTTIVATGPLTNIDRLLGEHPDCKPWIKRIIISGGVIPPGPDGKPQAGDHNLKLDPKAAQAVFTAKIPLVFVPARTVAAVQLDEVRRKQLFQAATPLTLQVQALYQLWDRPTPVLADAVAAALAVDESFCKVSYYFLQVDADGDMHAKMVKGNPNGRMVTAVRAEEFLKWYVERVSAGAAALPKAPPNPSKLIAHDGFPNRVHAFEDYATDIEKRWWMSGKLETANVPPGSQRACRGVLTQDFDDRMGDMQTMYTAVIFNPVPGPPMGKQPRLRFRYWLKGTDTLRVQIYSLTKGYHRCLTLTGLPQEKWQTATVDMTEVRRPDGSGGPLSENERIDDIQFYVDPRAELVIGDMVLYDAPAAGEKRPFPQRLHFTGLFDTGKQGKEWPGTFDIVDKGYFWKAAKSVPRQPDGAWIRLHLRGERPLGAVTHLTFRYQLTGAREMRVALVNRTTKDTHVVTLKELEQGAWAEATVDFSDAKAAPPRLGDRVDEIHFLLPDGAVLLVDDVLLYAPGK
jgi:inosine-uridine nucleoside N-ribohydrolase